jgi:lipopolysaccharide export system protein LptA
VYGTVRRLYGNVVLRQDTVSLRAARATQYEQRGEIFLEGSVRIISGDDTLTARHVTYDSNEKVAEAVGNVRISDGESVLLAPSATYFSRQKLATFTEGGRLLHEDAELTAPAGHYSTRDKLAEFEGPVELRDSTTVLTSQFGTYDTRAEMAVFSGEVHLQRRGVRIEADSLIYYRRTEVSTASGHVVLERFGPEQFGDAEDDADGGSGDPVAEPDSTQRSILFGAFGEHDAQSETSRVEGDLSGNPLLVQLRTDSTGVTDTTLVRARRFEAVRVDSLADRYMFITAVGEVRMAGPRLSAVADSAHFERVEPADSTSRPVRDRLSFFGEERPSIWFEDAQLSGDTLFAFALGESIEYMDIYGNAFAAQLDTTLGRVRQIRGLRMRALFEHDSLRTLSVWPNAEAIHFRATDEGLLDGADRLTADSLAFRFGGGRLKEVFGVRNVEGITYGPEIIPDPFRLPGYVFTPERRPNRTLLLPDNGWEASWLSAEPGANRPGEPEDNTPAPVEGNAASG